MLVLTYLELVVLVAMLSVGSSALKFIDDYASSVPVVAGAIDHEDRLRRLINGAIGCGAFALFALLVATAYHSTSALLLWLGRRTDGVHVKEMSHRELTLAPTTGVKGCCRVTMKILNITVGLLGIVAITLSASLFGMAQWEVDVVTWENFGHAKEIAYLLGVCMGLAILALLLKLTEALLGHVWAVLLSNTRDYATTMHDREITAPLGKSIA